MRWRNFMFKVASGISGICSYSRHTLRVWLLIAVFGSLSADAGEMRALRGHVPKAEALLQPVGRLSGTNSLRLAISLPLRNPEVLSNLLQGLYDPASPDYHRFLTPAQFNEKFGPTAREYQQVVDFARGNGLEILAPRSSRMMLDVRGKVSDVEKAVHVHLRKYRHPTEDRLFYAPDVEPSVDSSLPILDVIGLSDYAAPRPMLHLKADPPKGVPSSGSQAKGNYVGSDFRNAYAPGVSLTGAGQMVGLAELDGYYSNDIVSYEALAGLSNVPLVNVPVDGYSGTPSSGVMEVSLDIEMAIAMAPGLASVVVFEAGPKSGVTGLADVVDSMASSNQIKQLSSSWGFAGIPELNRTLDPTLQKMAAQGQSFFQSSGDGDAWVNPIELPADSPYLTCVGGTTLTMSGSGVAYTAETVWNEGNEGASDAWSPNGDGYIGSGGGVSTTYSIPTWQEGVGSAANGGSTTMRNIPDVAMAADNIWVTYANGKSGAVNGTSCSAPLWAGFIALANQQAAASGQPPVGFINPAIYALGQGPSYSACFHDVTVGNNTNAQSQNLYPAVAGFDLCTGWGTPNGAALINALVPEPLRVTPMTGFASAGPVGGPFSPASQKFVLTNLAPAALNWTVASSSPWLAASPSGGTLISGGAAATVSVSLDSAAALLPAGVYNSTVWLTNLNDTVSQGFQFTLTVTNAPLTVSWTNPAAISYGTALSSLQLNATANVAGSFAYSPPSGAVLDAGATALSVIFTPSDTSDYSSLTDMVSLIVSPATLSVTANNAIRPYGTPNPAFTGTITGLQNADNITVSYSCNADSSSPVGTYAIVPALVDPGNRQTNYTVKLVNGTLTVTSPVLLVTWTNPAPIIYGAALGSNQLDATANMPGSFSYNPTNRAVPNSGTNALSAIFTPTDSVDYGSVTDTVSLVVARAPLTVTAANAVRPYGQSNPTLTGTISGLTNGDNITVTYSCSATNGSPVGTYSITPALVDPGDRQTNYIVNLVNGTLTVTPGATSVSWTNPAPITYGTPLSSNQLDATANVPGSFAYNPPVSTVLSPGTNLLSVTFTSADASDYSSATDSVTLVVSPALAPLNIEMAGNAIVLSWNDPASVFALQAAPAVTGVFTNVPGAANPYTTALTGAQQYFRLTARSSR